MCLNSVVSIRTRATKALEEHGFHSPKGTASGVVICVQPNKALVLSAAHVINPMCCLFSPMLKNVPPDLGQQYRTPAYFNAAFTYELPVLAGQKYEATCVGYPAEDWPDIGLLKIEGKDFPLSLSALALSRRGSLCGTTPVTIVGYPEGNITIVEDTIFEARSISICPLAETLITDGHGTRVGFSGGAMIVDNELVGIEVSGSTRISGSLLFSQNTTRTRGILYSAIRAQFTLWLQDETVPEDVKAILASL